MKRKRTFLLCLAALFIHASSLHAQELDSVKGGYTSCHIYDYKYNSGVPDPSSKKEVVNYKYNSAGKMTEKQCFTGPCKAIFEGIYISNVAKEKYVYDDHGSITEETYYDPGGMLLIKITRKFDSQGNNTEELLYQSGELAVKTLSQYDKAGNKLEETKYSGNDYIKRNWTWDAKGKMIEEGIYNSSNSTTRKYYTKHDEYGNPIEYRSSDENDPVSYNSYTYDKDGNILDLVISGVRDTEKHWYKYDSLGRVIEHESYYQSMYMTSVTKTEYDASGGKTETTTASGYYAKSTDRYNSLGQITESASYTKEGEQISKTINTFDEFSNPLEVIKYNDSQEPVSQTMYVYSKQE